MSHNRVHANKSTFDSRAQHRQNRRPPTVPNMGGLSFIYNMTIYSDVPNFKWRSTGVHTFTHDAGAAAYVAECRRREIAKMNARLAWQVKPTVAQMLAKGVDARLGRAA